MNYDEQSEAEFFQLLSVQAAKECLQDQNIDEEKLTKFINLINEKYKDNVQQITYDIIEAYKSPDQLQQIRNSRKQIQNDQVSQNLVKQIENSMTDLKKTLNDLRISFEQQRTIEIPQPQFQSFHQPTQCTGDIKKQDIVILKKKIEELRVQIDNNKKDFNEIINTTMIKCIQNHCNVQSQELNRQSNTVNNVKKHLLGFYKFQNSAFNKINYIAHKMAMVTMGSSLMSTQQDDASRLRYQLKQTQMMLLQSTLTATQRVVDFKIQPELLKQPGIQNVMTKCEQLHRQLQSVETKVQKIQPTIIQKYTQIFNGFYNEQQIYIQNFTKVTTRSIQTLSDRIYILANQFEDFIYDRVYHRRLNMQIFQNENVRFLVKAAFLGKNNYVWRIQQALSVLDDKVTRQQQRFREIQLHVAKERKKIVHNLCAQIVGQFGKKFTETQRQVITKQKALMLRLNDVQDNLEKYKRLHAIQEQQRLKNNQLQPQVLTLSQPEQQNKQGENDTFKQGMKLIDQLAKSLTEIHTQHIKRIQYALQKINIQKLDLCNQEINELNRALEARTPISNQAGQRFSKHATPNSNALQHNDRKHSHDRNDSTDGFKKFPATQPSQGPELAESQYSNTLAQSKEMSLDDLDNTALSQDEKKSISNSKKPTQAIENTQKSLQNSKLQQSIQLDVFSDDEQEDEANEEEELQQNQRYDELKQFINENSSFVQSKYVMPPQMLHSNRIQVLREFIKKDVINQKVVVWLNNLYVHVGNLFNPDSCEKLAAELEIPYGDVPEYKRALKIYLLKIWDKQLEKQFLDAAIKRTNSVAKVPKTVAKYNRQHIGVLMQKFYETDDPFSTHISTVLVAFALYLHLFDYEPQSGTKVAAGKTLIQPLMHSSITDIEQLPQQAALKK